MRLIPIQTKNGKDVKVFTERKGDIFSGEYITHKQCGTVVIPSETGDFCPKCSRFIKPSEGENVTL